MYIKTGNPVCFICLSSLKLMFMMPAADDFIVSSRWTSLGLYLQLCMIPAFGGGDRNEVICLTSVHLYKFWKLFFFITFYMLVFMWVPYTGHPHQSVCCMRPPCSSDLHAVVSEKFKPSGISGFCIHRRPVGPLCSLCCPLLLAVNRISDKVKLPSIQEISGRHHVPECMTKMQVLTANCDFYSVSKCRQ